MRQTRYTVNRTLLIGHSQAAVGRSCSARPEATSSVAEGPLFALQPGTGADSVERLTGKFHVQHRRSTPSPEEYYRATERSLDGYGHQ